MIRHHPSSDRLTAFSAGSVPMSQALCISAHLEFCDQCRREVKRLNLIGSQLLHELQPAAVPADLKSRVLQQLTQQADTRQETALQPSPTTSKPGKTHQRAMPRCLQTLVPDGLDTIAWKRLSPSIFASKLCNDVNGGKVEMLKIKPGGQVASHNHTGEEITLVLEGSFSDDEGVYGPGDIIYRNREDKHHRPIASQDADCICLTAVEAPIQFTGFFAKLFNPFIRRSHYAS